MLFFWQMRSVSRWNDCAGPPEVICRSSVSTSNADVRSASLAAASCDPFWTPCGPEGRAKIRGCKLEIYLNTGWKRLLFDSWVDGGDVLYSHKPWPLTLWYKADSCEFSLDLQWIVCVNVDNTISSIWTITPDWCNKLPLRWINPKVLNRVGSILYSLQRLICHSHGQPCYAMVRFLFSEFSGYSGNMTWINFKYLFLFPHEINLTLMQLFL